MKFLVLLATLAIAGCGNSESMVSRSTPQETKGAHRLPYASLLDTHRDGNQEALRVRVDTVRNRLWVLAIDHVYVYDIAEKHLIRRIALPEWSVTETEFTCPPDMALDRSGTAFISHNVQPRLWQIDGDSFRLQEHVIRLLNRESWDIGFGGLAFAPDGTLFGITALAGSLWRIDIGTANAHQIELDTLVPDACTMPTPALVAQGVSVSRP